MNFTIITHVPHILDQRNYFAYGPYVHEMNIWVKQVDKIIIVAPISVSTKTVIDTSYEHENIAFKAIDSFDILSMRSIFGTILKTPRISWQIYKAMRKADHIHLRCPGNIGLLGCLIQILFPNTPKTAKYAGNWDPNSKQPWSYRLQKWILSNTFLTRNIQVLVYGKWNGSSKNINPFFTATYYEIDKLPILIRNLNGAVRFVFAGALVKGKNPLYTIQLIEVLFNKGYNVTLTLYGEGMERNMLEKYIADNRLKTIIQLQGNQSKETIQKAYQDSHFVVLPSDSEGWPKALAEGMFWGCVPLATSVSCVPFMLDYGKRGVLLEMDLQKDVVAIEALLKNQMDFDFKSESASAWSRQYTLDVFEKEVIGLLSKN
ncbi:glycosyltransferase family 4 protein [Flavobacterium sp. XS2P39]|uniref:glycosyltransferase family 4 protein n=1 Tax=Flavobacterium sp. XS2P39 TaxID=3401725 RepID=UPI003AACD3CF